MIIIGIGANLPHPEYGSPRRTCGAALSRLRDSGLDITARSDWYESAPVLASDHGAQGEQPWYVNAAIALDTKLKPGELLDRLLGIESEFGRIRSIANAPRTLDLDIVAYNERIIHQENLEIPHPRLDQRAFVLLPLADIAPDWKHPISGQSVSSMIENLPEGQDIRRMKAAEGAFDTEWFANEYKK